MFVFHRGITKSDESVQALKKGIDGDRRTEDGDTCGGRHIFNDTYTVAFRCLTGTISDKNSIGIEIMIVRFGSKVIYVLYRHITTFRNRYNNLIIDLCYHRGELLKG
uniref:Uncharacterized protein n=1 Tax=viral metagenome TaxID=1070528 RepID=A0A6C0KNN4_9ZZZZ